MIAKLTKRFFVVLLLSLLVLVLMVVFGILLADSSTNIIPVLIQIESWSKWHLFGVRLAVYVILVFGLSYWIRYKRPGAKPEMINRARWLVIKVLVIYELLFGVNVIGVLLS